MKTTSHQSVVGYTIACVLLVFWILSFFALGCATWTMHHPISPITSIMEPFLFAMWGFYFILLIPLGFYFRKARRR